MKEQGTVEVPVAAKKERQRSPNYPAVGLREAVERARSLAEKGGKAGAPAEIAAKYIGFGSAHGQAMSVLAALKRFGLVAEGNGRLAPTQRAMEIINLPADDPRRAAALREAALTPTIYRQLIADYAETGLPASEVLEAELATYKAFNPKAVSGFVKDFLDTLEYAGINESDALKSEQSEGDANDMPNPSTTIPAPKGGTTLNPAALLRAEEASRVTTPPTHSYSFALSMPRNVRAEVKIVGEVTKQDIARLKRQIEFLEEQFEEGESQ